MTLGNIYIDINRKAMVAYDAAMKKQKWFWCPICDKWFHEKKLEIAATQTYFLPSGKMACICFGVCEPCKNHAGKNLNESVANAMTERMARRAASGQEEKQDPRIKSIQVTEDELEKKT